MALWGLGIVVSSAASLMMSHESFLGFRVW